MCLGCVSASDSPSPCPLPLGEGLGLNIVKLTLLIRHQLNDKYKSLRTLRSFANFAVKVRRAFTTIYLSPSTSLCSFAVKVRLTFTASNPIPRSAIISIERMCYAQD